MYKRYIIDAENEQEFENENISLKTKLFNKYKNEE
jgi:hypothetical protein